jgi:sugar phosphate isomerase/epimerase
MKLSLSTHWNAARHRSGEALIEEILLLGFDEVELGYDLTQNLVPGVLRMVEQNAVRVTSVHNFCPVPAGAPFGHPELFHLASRNRHTRDSAVIHTSRTIEFAARMGARFVVTHAGRVDVRDRTAKLVDLYEHDKGDTDRAQDLRVKAMLERDRKAAPHLEWLFDSLQKLQPVLETTGVRLGLEILPTWDGIPAEDEVDTICSRFPSCVGYWHDIGHAQIRQNLGFADQITTLKRQQRWLCGVHVHDVHPPAMDHLLPPHGKIDFSLLTPFIAAARAWVLEPLPGMNPGDVAEGARRIREAWSVQPLKEGT